MHARQDDDLRVMVEVVPVRTVQTVQRRADCAVQYRYLVGRAGSSTTLEYVELEYGLLHSCEHICRRLSASFLWVAACLMNTADLLAATDERRRRAGYE